MHTKTIDKVSRVEMLLASGLSVGDIATLTRSDPRTIKAIRDKRFKRPKLKRTKPKILEVSDGVKLFNAESDYQWCESCRTRVKKPCLACQLRARRNRKHDAENH